MTPPENLKYVDVRLVCGRCRNEQKLYLRVDIPVPDKLRPKVQLGGGGVAGGMACEACHKRFPDISELKRLVEDELRGRSLRDHLRNGFVTITC